MRSSRADGAPPDSLPQWFWVLADIAYTHAGLCGSGLARDGGVSGAIDAECSAPIAGKPAPTVVLGFADLSYTQQVYVGAGLPAMAV